MVTLKSNLNQSAPVGADGLGNGRYIGRAQLFGAATNNQF